MAFFSRFFLSASHLATHFAIFARLDSLPTLTVAIILTQLNDMAKHVNSLNDECSEYGTGYSWTVGVDFGETRRSEYEKFCSDAFVRIAAIEGERSAPGWLYLEKNISI